MNNTIINIPKEVDIDAQLYKIMFIRKYGRRENITFVFQVAIIVTEFKDL